MKPKVHRVVDSVERAAFGKRLVERLAGVIVRRNCKTRIHLETMRINEKIEYEQMPS